MRGLVAMGFSATQLYTILCLRRVPYLGNGTFIVEFLLREFRGHPELTHRDSPRERQGPRRDLPREVQRRACNFSFLRVGSIDESTIPSIGLLENVSTNFMVPRWKSSFNFPDLFESSSLDFLVSSRRRNSLFFVEWLHRCASYSVNREVDCQAQVRASSSCVKLARTTERASSSYRFRESSSPYTRTRNRRSKIMEK